MTATTPANGDSVATRVRAFTNELRGLVDEPAQDAEAAAARVTAIVALGRMVDAARLAAVQVAVEHRAHELDGSPDTRTWLRTEHRMSGRAAKRDSETARALTVMPSTSAALQRGEITIDAAAAMANAWRRGRLGDGEAIETHLLDAATSMAPDQFARHVRRTEIEVAPDDQVTADTQRGHAMRELTMHERPDGLWELHVVGEQAGIEIIGTALAAFMTHDPADTPDELRRSFNTRRYDALVDVCNAALSTGTAPTTGTVRPHVSVIVPAELLVDPTADVGGETATTGPLTPEATRRHLCDATVSRIVMTAQSEILDVGRATRIWSAAQRRALVARDGGCRGPSCDRPAAWCDAHHIKWWTRDRGPTDLDNGLLLCHHCHVLVHEGGWRVALQPDGAVATWTSPRGTAITTHPSTTHQRRLAVA